MRTENDSMAVRLIDLQLLYGIAGAREQFENLCAQLFRSEHPTATGIRVHRGDGGIDVYEGKFTGEEGIHVVQVKFFPNGIRASQQQEIRESLTRCVTNTQFTTNRWTLYLPVDLSVEETRWFETWAEAKETEYGIAIDWKGATYLEGLLYRSDNRGIKEAFFQEEHLIQIRETHHMLKKLIDDFRTRPDEAQQKDLKAQAEERFKTAVTALGDSKEGTQVGGAILLRSFLNKEDKQSYERYYPQIFDLAVAHLRFPRLYRSLEDALPLTTLSQALIVVFKESFPLARDRMKEQYSHFNTQALDASNTQLDHANLNYADLKQAWLEGASFREAHFFEANLAEANLARTDLAGANLMRAKLNNASLFGANLSGAKLNNAELNETLLFGANLSQAHLCEANFSQASLHGAGLSGANLGGADLSHADLMLTNFSGARLFGANLSESNLNQADLSNADLSHTHLGKVFLTDANLSGADLSSALLFDTATSLERADLRGVKGLTKEQLAACKAKGAIIDEDATTNIPQPIVAPSSPPQSNDAYLPSAAAAQASTPLADPDRSNTVSSKPEPES